MKKIYSILYFLELDCGVLCSIQYSDSGFGNNFTINSKNFTCPRTATFVPVFGQLNIFEFSFNLKLKNIFQNLF